MAKRTPKKPNLPNALQEMRKARGLNAEAIAELIGTSTSQVSKMEKGDLQIRPEYLFKIADFLGVDPIDLFPALRAQRRPQRTVDVRGTLRAGLWQKNFDWVDDRVYRLRVPIDPRYAADPLYAAEVEGTSMNRSFPSGSVVVLRRRNERTRDIEDGAAYHVEIQRRDGTIEATLKRARRGRDGRWWLMPDSDDPEYQTPIEARGGPGEAVEIVGRVVAALIPQA